MISIKIQKYDSSIERDKCSSLYFLGGKEGARERNRLCANHLTLRRTLDYHLSYLNHMMLRFYELKYISLLLDLLNFLDDFVKCFEYIEKLKFSKCLL